MADTATFRVWRGDGRGGRFEDYSTPVSEGMVVLDAIHQIQAIVGSHPKASSPVLIGHAHIVVAQTCGIHGVMQIASKRVGFGIEAI